MAFLCLDVGLDGIVGRHERNQMVAVRLFGIDKFYLIVFHLVPFNITKITISVGFSAASALPLNLLRLLAVVVLFGLVGDSTAHGYLLAEKGDFKFPIGFLDSLDVVLFSYGFLRFHIK